MSTPSKLCVAMYLSNHPETLTTRNDADKVYHIRLRTSCVAMVVCFKYRVYCEIFPPRRIKIFKFGLDFFNKANSR